MSQRTKFFEVAPEAMKPLLELATHASGLESSLLELVNMRASQINGCAFCLDMHWKDARAAGETEQRLYCLPAWRETKFYNERERTALELTENLTLVAENRVSDELYERARKQFSEKELAYLVLAIATINTFNRLNIAFESEAGWYQPGMFSSEKTNASSSGK
jgi:AhpD family alkylhydroperoxidase